MDDLDRTLARLAEAPAPPALDVVEARVLARIGAPPSARTGALGLAAVTLAGLAIGLVGADFPAAASPAPSFSPLGGSMALAPSTLLGEP